MRVLKISRKDNFLDLMPEVVDDLWHLEKIIEPGDVVTGLTERKIKPKEPGAKAFKQKMHLDLEVEEVKFDKYSGALRVSGVILGGRPEELVDLKAHHSLEFEPGRRLKIKKKELKGYHLERLKKAEASLKKAKLLVLLLDDERADFALLSDYGLDEKATVFSGKHGKQFQSEESNRYFSELLQKIEEIGVKKVLIAGPGFTKGNFQKYLADKRTGLEVSFHTTNSVGKTGFSEILKKGLGVKAVEELEIVREAKLVDEVLAELGKGSGLVAYGLAEVKKAVELGAVKMLLLAEKFFLENREEIEPLMDLTEKVGGSLHILSAEHEATKRIEELTGIVALLRYRLE